MKNNKDSFFKDTKIVETKRGKLIVVKEMYFGKKAFLAFGKSKWCPGYSYTSEKLAIADYHKKARHFERKLSTNRR